MSSKAHAERLAKALESTSICEIVRTDHSHDQVRILLRLSAGAEGAWTQAIDRILTAAEFITGKPHIYNAHICKNYFRKQVSSGEKKLVFGWYVSVQSNSMTESLDVVIRALKGSLPAKPANRDDEDWEMPLATKARELNAPNENGRGGWTVGGKSSFKPLRGGGA